MKRIASTGINLVVLGVSVGIILMAFLALNALGAAHKLLTVSVLSATRDLKTLLRRENGKTLSGYGAS